MCLHHPSTGKIVYIMLRELLTPDIQGVKSIRSVGAVFEQILFRLGVLLVVLVLAEILGIYLLISH